MSRSNLPALLAAILAASCSSARPPGRTVPEPSLLPPAAREAYEDALRRAAAGDPAGADAALAPALAARPLHVSSHLLHQDLAGEAGRGASLGPAYASLAAGLPSDGGAAVLEARVVPGTGAERVARYQAAAAKDARSPWPRIALALSRTSLALELSRRAEARALEGFAEEARGLRAEATATLDRARAEGESAVALAPDLAAAHAALGRALAVRVPGAEPADEKEARALHARALEVLGRALALDPGDPRVLLERALLLRRLGKREEAEADLAAAARSAPRDAAVHAARAGNLEELGRSREAREAWAAALAAAPDWPEAWLDAGSAFARAGLWIEALERYRRADAIYAARGGERWKARRGIATALSQIGLDASDPSRFAEALEQLRAYRSEGGPDRDWAARMAELLGEEEATASPPPPPRSSPPTR